MPNREEEPLVSACKPMRKAHYQLNLAIVRNGTPSCGAPIFLRKGFERLVEVRTERLRLSEFAVQPFRNVTSFFVAFVWRVGLIVLRKDQPNLFVGFECQAAS